MNNKEKKRKKNGKKNKDLKSNMVSIKHEQVNELNT